FLLQYGLGFGPGGREGFLDEPGRRTRRQLLEELHHLRIVPIPETSGHGSSFSRGFPPRSLFRWAPLLQRALWAARRGALFGRNFVGVAVRKTQALERRFDAIQAALQGALIAHGRTVPLEPRVGLPPADADFSGLVDGRDQQTQLDRQELDVHQVDGD